MKNIITIIMILLLLAFPQKAYCGESVSAYYLCFDNGGNNYWHQQNVEIDVLAQSGDEAIIIEVLHQLFRGADGHPVYPYPPGSKVLEAKLENHHLRLNLSTEMGNFGGGSYLEQALINQILKTALAIQGVEKVTLLVENKTGNLPEGIVVEEVTTWNEMTEEPMTK